LGHLPDYLSEMAHLSLGLADNVFDVRYLGFAPIMVQICFPQRFVQIRNSGNWESLRIRKEQIAQAGSNRPWRQNL
jgi:hypothetical protein